MKLYWIQRPIYAGVPQGSILLPTLYSIFTSNFKSQSNLSIALYAYDTAIIISIAIVKKMKGAIIHAEKYFNKWKIQINQEETQGIIFQFNKSPKRIPNITFRIQGILIHRTWNVKYFGIFFDKLLACRHQKSAESKSPKKYFNIFSLMSDLGFEFGP